METNDHDVIMARLQSQQELLEKIYRSVEKTRKYFMWTLIATIVAFVLPLIALGFVVPYYFQEVLRQYQSILKL